MVTYCQCICVLASLLVFCVFGQQQTTTVCNGTDLQNGHYIGPDGEPANATSVFIEGTIITALCQPGYVVYGCQQLWCNESGIFDTIIPGYSAGPPHCEDINECRQPSINAEGEASSSYSSSVDVEIDACLAIEQPPPPPPADCHRNARCSNIKGSYICVCDGDFVGDGVKTCKYDPPVCDTLPAPTNGYIIRNTSKTTEFACDINYRLYGYTIRKCAREGWDGYQPICEATGCGDPGTPSHGRKIGDSYGVDKKVIFDCAPGYILQGSRSRSCTVQKRWSGWQPTCLPPPTLSDLAGGIRRDFIDKFELYTISSKAGSAQGRLSRGNTVGLDLVFAFDKSSSVGTGNFRRGINFTKMIIEEFGVDYESLGSTRVAVVSFADVGITEFNFDDGFDTKEKVFQRLDELEETRGGGTAMKEALERVKLEVTPQTRNNSKKALFIVTDGHANTENPVAIAEDLRTNDDYEIFAIGVGNDIAIDYEQIRSVASPPYTSHVFLIKSFEDLAEITEIIAEKRTDYTACGVAGDWELPDDEVNANPHAWPWMAVVKREQYGYHCEGTLICEQWVMVSASCLDGNPHPFLNEPEVVQKEKLYVEFGKHNLYTNQGCAQNATVTEIHRPDTYNNDTRDSDIALLKLDHPIQLVNCIRTMCLPTKEDTFNFKRLGENRCYLAGWGCNGTWYRDEAAVAEGTSALACHTVVTPRQVNLPLVYHGNCDGVEDDDSVFCAGNQFKTNDECIGKLGSPLVCRRDDKSWSVLGVTSDGVGCSRYDQYTHFTKVYDYVDWINNITESCNVVHQVKPFGG